MKVNYNEIPEKYIQYPKAVFNGDIIVGSYIKLVCKRYVDFLKRDDVYFDTDKADKVVNFIRKLKHTESPWTGKPFILEPWQQFVVYCMFGLYWKRNDRRVCRSAYIQIARKCGKSSLASALALYGLVADGEMGAEIYFCSPSNSQTQQDFKYTKQYVETINRGGIFNVLQSKILFPPKKSILKCMTPKAKLGDGFNPHFAVIDEYHAMENNDLPNVMVSGMGARKNPMLIYITTAGFNIGGPCKEFHDSCIDILKGQKEDDTVWPFIYEIDEEDDWRNPEVWPKAVPSLPKVVEMDFMQQRVQHAKNNPGDEVDVRTKNINQWVSSSTTWIPDDDVLAMMEDVPIEVFYDQPVYCSIDLANTSDLTAYTIMMPPDQTREYHPDSFVFKTFYYLPEKNLNEGKNWMQYRTWNNQGKIVITPGDTTDYQYILDEMQEHMYKMRIINVSYDSFQATFLIVKAEQSGLPCAPFSQSLGNFNSVIQNFEIFARKNLIVIDNNPITRWNFQNIDMYTNSTGLRKPKKGTDKTKKIDGAITMLQAVGNWISDGGSAADVTFTYK